MLCEFGCDALGPPHRELARNEHGRGTEHNVARTRNAHRAMAEKPADNQLQVPSRTAMSSAFLKSVSSANSAMLGTIETCYMLKNKSYDTHGARTNIKSSAHVEHTQATDAERGKPAPTRLQPGVRKTPDIAVSRPLRDASPRAIERCSCTGAACNARHDA
jgi:hypothetical protein